MIVKSDMKKIFTFLVIGFLVFALHSNAVPLDSVGNNRILWTQNFEGRVYDCAFMPDENYMIIARDTVLEIRRTADQSLVRSKYFDGIVSSLDVSRDGKYVAIGNTVMLLDINTFEVIKDYKRGGGSISFSPDGKKLAFAGAHFAYVLDVETGKELFQFGEGIDQFQYMYITKFSPDGKWLVCDYQGGDDKKIYVFDVNDNFKLYANFNYDDKTPHGADGYPLIFSPNNQYLLAHRAAGYAFRIWDLNTKVEILSQKGQQDGISDVSGIAFFKDNKTLFFNNEKTSSFYDLNQKKVIKDLLFFVPLSRDLVFSSDETKLLGVGLCLIQIDKSILSIIQGIKKETVDIIAPNPTTGMIQIKIALPYSDILSISIINSNGDLIEEMNKGIVISGTYETSYDSSPLPAGVYFIKVSQRDFNKSFKIIKEN